MDSQREQKLIAAQIEPLDEQAEQEEQSRAWATEQALLADKQYMRRHGVEKP